MFHNVPLYGLLFDSWVWGDDGCHPSNKSLPRTGNRHLTIDAAVRVQIWGLVLSSPIQEKYSFLYLFVLSLQVFVKSSL